MTGELLSSCIREAILFLLFYSSSFLQGNIEKDATWSGPPSDRYLSSLLSIFVRFQSRKMSRNVQGGDRRRVGLESFIDSDSVLSVIDEIWLRIEALLYWYIRACSTRHFVTFDTTRICFFTKSISYKSFFFSFSCNSEFIFKRIIYIYIK